MSNIDFSNNNTNKNNTNKKQDDLDYLVKSSFTITYALLEKLEEIELPREILSLIFRQGLLQTLRTKITPFFSTTCC